jgi:hypothetical protein
MVVTTCSYMFEILHTHIHAFQTKDYGIDWMHTVDSGCGKMAFFLLLRTGYEKKEKWKHVSRHLNERTELPKFKANVEDAFAVFRVCLSSDFARKPRSPFSAANLYKTAEMRTAVMRFSPALLHIPRVWRYLDHALARNFMNLVSYCKLIGTFSTKPLPKVNNTQAASVAVRLMYNC